MHPIQIEVLGANSTQLENLQFLVYDDQGDLYYEHFESYNPYVQFNFEPNRYYSFRIRTFSSPDLTDIIGDIAFPHHYFSEQYSGQEIQLRLDTNHTRVVGITPSPATGGATAESMRRFLSPVFYYGNRLDAFGVVEYEIVRDDGIQSGPRRQLDYGYIRAEITSSVVTANILIKIYLDGDFLGDITVPIGGVSELRRSALFIDYVPDSPLFITEGELGSTPFSFPNWDGINPGESNLQKSVGVDIYNDSPYNLTDHVLRVNHEGNTIYNDFLTPTHGGDNSYSYVPLYNLNVGVYLVELLRYDGNDWVVVASTEYYRDSSSNVDALYFHLTSDATPSKTVAIELNFTESNVRYDEYEVVIANAQNGDPLRSMVFSHSYVQFNDVDFDNILVVITHIPTGTLMLNENRVLSNGWNSFHFWIEPIRRKFHFLMVEDGDTKFREGITNRWQLQNTANRPILTNDNGELDPSFLPPMDFPNTKVYGTSSGFIPTNWFVALEWDSVNQQVFIREATSGDDVIVGFNRFQIPDAQYWVEADTIGIVHFGVERFSTLDVGKQAYMDASGNLTTVPYQRADGSFARVGIVVSPFELLLTL